jgi:hypothetical protein
MAIQALAAVQAVYEAFGRGDIPAILGMLTPDVAWTVEGKAGDYPTFGRRQGPDGALKFFQAVADAEEITAFAPRRFHSTDDTVVVEGDISVTLKKNGRSLSYDWVHIFTVRDGKIAGFRELYDTATVVEAYRAPR